MFRMFQNRAEPGKENPRIDKAATTIAGFIIRLQTYVVKWLSRQEQTLTIKQKKIAFLVFCISTGIITGTILFRGLFGYHNQNSDWLQNSRITIPKTHSLPDSLDLNMLRELEKRKTFDQKKTDSIHP